jgi:hypothetical protein
VRIGAAVAFLAAAIALRAPLEARMSLHMLVQLPMLAAAGWLLAGSRAVRPSAWDRGGVAGLLFASAVMATWMVPRALDAAVEWRTVDLLKLASMTAAGAIAARSWRRAHVATQLFMAGNTSWMLATVGVVLGSTTSRLCVSYGADDQQRTGDGLVVLAVLLLAAVAWSVRAVWLQRDHGGDASGQRDAPTPA